jgi:hypothetical protein
MLGLAQDTITLEIYFCCWVASHDDIELFTLAHHPKGTQTINGFYPFFLIYLNLHVAAQIKFRQPMLFNPVKDLLSQDQFNVCMHKTRHRLKQVHRRKVKVRESHKTSSFQLFIGAQFHLSHSSTSQLHLIWKHWHYPCRHLHISNIYKAYSRYFFCIEFIF